MALFDLIIPAFFEDAGKVARWLGASETVFLARSQSIRIPAALGQFTRHRTATECPLLFPPRDRVAGGTSNMGDRGMRARSNSRLGMYRLEALRSSGGQT